jgi:hypothetical protein
VTKTPIKLDPKLDVKSDLKKGDKIDNYVIAQQSKKEQKKSEEEYNVLMQSLKFKHDQKQKMFLASLPHNVTKTPILT